VYLEYDNTDVTPTPDPEYEPEVFPYGVSIKADSDPEYVGINDPNATSPEFDIDDFDTNKAISGKRKIIGIVNLSLNGSGYMIDYIIQAESQRGDWIDRFYMLDSEDTLENETGDDKGKRSSIDVNPCKDSPYYMKAQLKEINNCAANSTPSIPYFQADDQTQGDGNIGATGGLKWAAVDSKYTPITADTPDSKTIDITTDESTSHLPDSGESWDEETNSYKVMHLHGVLDTEENSKSIGYYDSTTTDAGTNWTQGEFKWASLDGDLEFTAFSSIEVNIASPATVQLRGFTDVATDAEETSQGAITGGAIDWGVTDFATDDSKFVLVAVQGGTTQTIQYLYPTQLDVVTDVSWDAANHKLVQEKTTCFVLGYESPATDSDITTATDCP